MKHAHLLIVFVLFISPAAAAQTTDLEEDFWKIASDSNSLETINTFLEAFPESQYADEARTLAAGLQDDTRRLQFEESIFELIGQVTYEEPLKFGNDAIIGQSLASITALSPLYPPVEGLPEEYWKEQNCTNCHQWSRADLCTQSKTYVEKQPIKYHSKQHPFGGLLKINMRNWALGGCQ